MDNATPINKESKEMVEELNNFLAQMPQEEIEKLVTMNRKARRAWMRSVTRRRGRGFTK